jgi:hypothetical protein
MHDRDEITLIGENNILHGIDSPLIGEYIAIFLQNSQVANNQEDMRVLFYRGQSDKDFLLTPYVFRKGLLPKEHLLIQNLLLNSPDEFSGAENSLERLIKMQHYGLPTRLLDVTMNPLVALFFACNESKGKDGEIFVFYDYMKRPNDFTARCIIALTEYYGSSERQMLGFLTERGITNPELGNLTKLPYVPIEVPRSNERIKRQHGAFMLFGIHGEEDGNPYQKINFDLKPLLTKNSEGISHSLVIPHEHKDQLLKELDALGINHAFLFPELEHQASYIRSKYEE